MSYVNIHPLNLLGFVFWRVFWWFFVCFRAFCLCFFVSFVCIIFVWFFLSFPLQIEEKIILIFKSKRSSATPSVSVLTDLQNRTHSCILLYCSMKGSPEQGKMLKQNFGANYMIHSQSPPLKTAKRWHLNIDNINAFH